MFCRYTHTFHLDVQERAQLEPISLCHWPRADVIGPGYPRGSYADGRGEPMCISKCAAIGAIEP